MSIVNQAKIDEYYEALLNRDSKYVGVFYVGVKTTLVFCISTCRARKPLKKNTIFYRTYGEAIKNGFRACKICRPTENSNQTPDQIKEAIRLVIDHPKKKISDSVLRNHNISPDIARRWFKKTYGITFHSFQRMHRINSAYKELKDGKQITHAAYNSG
ncbi:MAG: Ada metal-binding domain-containing protein, partial [Bacteroidota bacterium]